MFCLGFHITCNVVCYCCEIQSDNPKTLSFLLVGPKLFIENAYLSEWLKLSIYWQYVVQRFYIRPRDSFYGTHFVVHIKEMKYTLTGISKVCFNPQPLHFLSESFICTDTIHVMIQSMTDYLYNSYTYLQRFYLGVNK